MKDVKILTGGVDGETPLHYVKEGDVIFSQNTISYNGIRIPYFSQKEVAWRAGQEPTNGYSIKEIVEDKQNNRAILFVDVYGGIRIQGIASYSGGVIEWIIPPISWGVSHSRPIYLHQGNNSSVVIDGKYLIWTNGFISQFSGDIYGGRTRKIDLNKANMNGKRGEYRMLVSEQSFVNNSTFSLTVTNLLTNTVITPTTVIQTNTGNQTADTASLIAALAGYNITATEKDGVFTITSNANDLYVRIENNSAVGIKFYPVNHYPLDMDSKVLDEMFALANKPPLQRPIPKYVRSAVIKDQNLFGKSFRFMYRYIYDDGSMSAFSPISHVPTNFTQRGYDVSTLNEDVWDYIKVGIKVYDMRSVIRKVEVAFNWGGANGVWRSFGVFDVEDLGFYDVSVEFKNNGTYSVIPSDTFSAKDTQAFKNYDHVPIASLAVSTVIDKDGKTAVVLLGNKIRYDSPKVDATIDIVKITGVVDTSLEQSSENKGLKAGGIYRVAVIHGDGMGRTCSPSVIKTVVIPYGDQIGMNNHLVHALHVTINSDPPQWADWARIVISENQNQFEYIQYYAHTSKNAHIDATGNVDLTGGDYGELGLLNSIEWKEHREDGNYLMFNDAMDTARFLDFTGDYKTQLILGGGVVQSELREWNFRVIGKSWDSGSSSNGFSLLVDRKDKDMTTLNAGGMFEVYKKKDVFDGVYYEIGFKTDITSGAYGGRMDTDGFGDTYIRIIEKAANGYTLRGVESKSLYGNDSDDGDIGRGHAIYENGQISAINMIRMSGMYGDGIDNGLPSFTGVGDLFIDKEYGAITGATQIGSVLLVVAQRYSQGFYIGQSAILTRTGMSLQANAESLLSRANEYAIAFGAPVGGIKNTGHFVFGFDNITNTFWSYNTGNGFRDISYGMPIVNEVKFVFTGYSPKDKIVYFSLVGSKGSVDKVIGYNVRYKKWEGYFWIENRPKVFGEVGNDMLVCPSIRINNRSKLFIQYKATDRANKMFDIYNEKSEIWCVVNKNPFDDKELLDVGIHGLGDWVVAEIYTIRNGGKLITKEVNSKQIYSTKYVPVMRDMGDKRSEFDGGNPAETTAKRLRGGNKMVGDVFVIKLVNASPNVTDSIISIKTKTDAT